MFRIVTGDRSIGAAKLVLLAILCGPFLLRPRCYAADAAPGDSAVAADHGSASPIAGTRPTEPAEEPADRPRDPDSNFTRTGEGTPPTANSGARLKYSRKGLQIESSSKNFKARINWRSQLRFSTPYDDAPRRTSHFSAPDENAFGFERARFKMKGNLVRPWLEYDFEHDLVGNRVLNLQFTLAKFDWLQLRVGQGKVNFNRERVDSSGRQQFAERSIVNREFTLDRQKGVAIEGHLFEGRRADAWYSAGVYTGTGRGANSDHDGHPMWVARYQWNFLGRDLDFSQSDVEHHDKPVASIAFGAATNRGRYTRFSSSGGGHLDDFQPGLPGQYSLRQFVEETALKYRGFSLQHEYHWKHVTDHIAGRETDLRGSYVQAGYFFHNLMPRIPRQLELGARFAFVDPRVGLARDLRQETALVANWFFEGHDNKLTFDFSKLTLARAEQPGLSANQVRLQWDVSF